VFDFVFLMIGLDDRLETGWHRVSDMAAYYTIKSTCSLGSLGDVPMALTASTWSRCCLSDFSTVKLLFFSLFKVFFFFRAGD
jgi:hypothetical protein